jgi:hypothetical protein
MSCRSGAVRQPACIVAPTMASTSETLLADTLLRSASCQETPDDVGITDSVDNRHDPKIARSPE